MVQKYDINYLPSYNKETKVSTSEDDFLKYYAVEVCESHRLHKSFFWVERRRLDIETESAYGQTGRFGLSTSSWALI